MPHTPFSLKYIPRQKPSLRLITAITGGSDAKTTTAPPAASFRIRGLLPPLKTTNRATKAEKTINNIETERWADNERPGGAAHRREPPPEVAGATRRPNYKRTKTRNEKITGKTRERAPTWGVRKYVGFIISSSRRCEDTDCLKLQSGFHFPALQTPCADWNT